MRSYGLVLAALTFSLAANAQADGLSSLVGRYSLDKRIVGDCYARIEIVQESFLNAVGPNLGIYGLPQGQGLIVAQVLDINRGYKVDVNENPMAILPGSSSIIGYRPREASFDGNRLRYREGELAKAKNPNLHKGDVHEVELKNGILSVRSGTFSLWGDEFTDVCAYVPAR
ncbi:MAG: hypothetical protein NTY77_11910 [Elusimicrobia bacterium]|nr:hypothetical protein [Elusimicrobiota bacterium]